jgi:hypothetical protein
MRTTFAFLQTLKPSNIVDSFLKSLLEEKDLKIVLNLSPSQHFFSLLKIQMLFQPMWFVEIAMEKTNLF